MITFDGKLRPAIGDRRRRASCARSSTTCFRTRSSTRRATRRSNSNVGVRDGFAVLDVIDQGRGVAPADRSRIFESFYQGPPPVEGRVKGSGLGLAIAREYALAQGGRIEVAGRGDGRSGAWFRLSLPLATGEAAREAGARDRARERQMNVAHARCVASAIALSRRRLRNDADPDHAGGRGLRSRGLCDRRR